MTRTKICSHFFAISCSFFLLIPDIITTYTNATLAQSSEVWSSFVVDEMNYACNFFSHFDYLYAKKREKMNNSAEKKEGKRRNREQCKKMIILCMMIWKFCSIPILSFTYWSISDECMFQKVYQRIFVGIMLSSHLNHDERKQYTTTMFAASANFNIKWRLFHFWRIFFFRRRRREGTQNRLEM